MTPLELFLLITVLLTVVAAVVAMIRAVRSDGYGHTAPPRSYEAWDVQGWGDPLRR